MFIKAGAPSLRCIQLEPIRQSDYSWGEQMIDKFKSWSLALEAEGIRLEDIDGRLLCRDVD
jgi:hypothetical protein